MESTNVVQRGNTLEMNLVVTYSSQPFEKLSPEYLISGSAVFQVRVTIVQVTYNSNAYEYSSLIFVRFVKLKEDDDLTYKAMFSSVALGIYNKSFVSDEGTWHLINERKGQGYSFDVRVCVETLSASSFASLHEDMELTDFELRGDDGAIHMHKAVLAATSPVLRTMLAGKWKETTEGYVDVPGTSKMMLQHLKDYMYLHTLPETGLEQLLLLSSYYMMPNLEQRCVDKLVNGLRAENACELLDFAVKHKVTRLMLAILEWVQNGAVQVSEMRRHFVRSEKKQ